MNLVYYDLYQATRLEKFVTGMSLLPFQVLIFSLHSLLVRNEYGISFLFLPVHCLQHMGSSSNPMESSLLHGKELLQWRMYLEKLMWLVLLL